jgi:hypothetical protein
MATAKPRQHRFRRFVAPLLVLLVILMVTMLFVAWMPVRQAREEWWRGHDARAIEIANRWRPMHLWTRQYEQILAAAYLTLGNRAAAAPHLAAVGTPWISPIDKADVARRLFARGRYADFAAYDAAYRDRSETPDVPLYRAAAAVAMNQPDAAARLLGAVDRSKVDATRYEWLRTTIEQRRAGRAPYLLDRDGKVIAAYRPESNDVIALDASFASLVDAKAGALTIGAELDRLGTSQTLESTLDPFVQKAALEALGGIRGSLVAIDPRTNEILAIASSPGKGAVSNLAIEQQYEPGSVVKVLTGLNALNGGVDIDKMFPYTCKGELMIDGRHFGDWLPQGHGTLKSLDDALAVSCNVFFADLGLRLKRERLEEFMTSAGFNSNANLGFIPAPLGRIVGDVFNNFETAFLAIGLQHETMNALHVSMVAAMVANRGMYAVPRLLRQRRTIIGDVVTSPAPPAAVRLASAAAAQRMVQAMVAVANDPRGTGRRAPVEGISIAMKTGTAGDRKSGLEALILAFAPVESPKIAFGVIAEDAGPAEFAGARIAHDFLEKMKPRL